MAWSRSPMGYKAIRYSAVSVICLVISLAVLSLTYGVLRLASAVDCTIIATAVSTVPSYTLNRRWVWRREGRSHMWKEVVPFWTLAAASFAFSLYAVALADGIAGRAHLSHLWRSILVDVAQLAAYGILWVGKFVILNRLLFADGRGGAGRDGDGRDGDGRDGGEKGRGSLASAGGSEPGPAGLTRQSA